MAERGARGDRLPPAGLANAGRAASPASCIPSSCAARCAASRSTPTPSSCATAARSANGRRRCSRRRAASSTGRPARSARRSRSRLPPAPPRRGAPVIAVMGDGTFGFHMAEFDTAVRCNLPFVAVVGNDATWNAEHQIQLREYGPNRTHGCELLPSRYDLVVAGARRPRRTRHERRRPACRAGARARQRQARLRQRHDRARAGAGHSPSGVRLGLICHPGPRARESHPSSCSSACGWLDPGNKYRDDALGHPSLPTQPSQRPGSGIAAPAEMRSVGRSSISICARPAIRPTMTPNCSARS